MLSFWTLDVGLIAGLPGPLFVVQLLPAATAQLVMPVPPLSLNGHFFVDDRARLDWRHRSRIVNLGEENCANRRGIEPCIA